jgi:hypothetical protein
MKETAMRRSTQGAAYLLAAVMVMLACPALALAGDVFQGKWKVVVTPDEDARGAGEKEFKDTLVFKGDQFTAEACVKHGFKSAKYEADTRRGPTSTFTAKTESKTEGKAEWSGFVTGSNIQGELTWTKKDGTVLRYSFKGEKQ